ncbi:S1 RNA-binding domain-containing protein, partial [Patescibacteria group bacterium]
AVWEEQQKGVIAQYKIGDTVEGEVTAIADFGAFVKFDSLEGLVHISEIAWQRIDHPRDLLKMGETVKAEIIGIEGSKIFLSMKKLISDPWQDVVKKYNIGDVVEGRILKVNPFGFFVELDPEIHGLAHVSEVSETPVTDITTLGKPGETKNFKIVSIEPQEHRLGLSMKGITGEETVTKMSSSETEEINKEEKLESNRPEESEVTSQESEDKTQTKNEETTEETK